MFVLHNEAGAIKGLWRLQAGQGAKALLKSKLVEMEYPTPNHEQYLVFAVEQTPGPVNCFLTTGRLVSQYPLAVSSKPM